MVLEVRDIDPFARLGSLKTACRPGAELPSLMTANENFFCFLMDLTHPFTWIDEDGFVGEESS